MVDEDCGILSVRQQCDLLGLNRSTLYYSQASETGLNIVVRNKIDEIYTKWPFYGSRKMAVVVGEELAIPLNRKRMQRHMREFGLAAVGPGPSTSKAAPGHKVFPYLLRGMRITQPNQVWSTDITYVRLHGGFAYFEMVNFLKEVYHQKGIPLPPGI